MNWKDMVQKIHSLVVFRSIWDDEVFQKFAAMLQAVWDGAEKAVDTYAAFVAALYQRGEWTRNYGSAATERIPAALYPVR